MTGSHELAGQSVLITRPLQHAKYLRDKVAQLGGRPIVFPTLSICHQTQGLDQNSLTNHELAIFISRNSVAAVAEYFEQSSFSWPQSLKCAAVGDKTAQAIHLAFGVDEVVTPTEGYGIEALMCHPRMQHVTEQRIIFFDGGGERSVLLLGLLQNRGCGVVTHAIVYTRVNPNTDANPLISTLQRDGLDYAIFSSVTGAVNLLDLLDTESVRMVQSACMIVYSERIANQLACLGFKQIVIAPSASDYGSIEAILMLQSHETRLQSADERGVTIIRFDRPIKS